jgi:hypothetical protein
MTESVAKASPEVQVTVVSKFFIRKVVRAVCQSRCEGRRVFDDQWEHDIEGVNDVFPREIDRIPL